MSQYLARKRIDLEHRLDEDNHGLMASVGYNCAAAVLLNIQMADSVEHVEADVLTVVV